MQIMGSHLNPGSFAEYTGQLTPVPQGYRNTLLFQSYKILWKLNNKIVSQQGDLWKSKKTVWKILPTSYIQNINKDVPHLYI